MSEENSLERARKITADLIADLRQREIDARRINGDVRPQQEISDDAARKTCEAQTMVFLCAQSRTFIENLRETLETKSGYSQCACRDCFEIAISDDTSDPEMCWECEEYGCEPDSECQSPNAYGGGE